MMSKFMRLLRPFVFVVFVVCCAIVASVSVWNLSIVDSITSEDETTVKQIDAFLIFLGASGLFLIFPAIFFELLETNIFLGKVWFELVWVGLYGLMYLAGASAATAQYSNSSCSSDTGFQALRLDGSGVSEKSPCLSGQLLQAFTWIAAIFLIIYFAVLFVVAAVKHQEDKTVWTCSVRQFEWLQGRVTLKSNPASPSLLALPRFNGQIPTPTALPPPQMAQPPQPPVILAPRPRPLAALRNAVLSYRSGLSSEYEVEQFKTTPSDGPSGLGYGYHKRQTEAQKQQHQRGDSDSSRFTPSGFSHQPDSEMQQSHQRYESESSRFTPSGFTHTPVPSTIPEPTRPPPLPATTTTVQRPMPPVPAVNATEHKPAATSVQRQPSQIRQLPQPVTVTPFYSNTVQQAIAPDNQQPVARATYPIQQRPQLTIQTQAEPVRPLAQNVRPLPPSPPPLGDWPRLDATLKPRVKRKLPQPVIAAPEPAVQPQQMTEMQKQKSREPSQPEAGPSRSLVSPEPLPRLPSGSGSGKRRSSARYQRENQPLGVTLNAVSEDEPVDYWSQPQQSQPKPRPQISSTVARESISSPVDPVALSAALSSLAGSSINTLGQGSSSKPSGVRGPRQSVLGMIAGPSRRFS